MYYSNDEKYQVRTLSRNSVNTYKTNQFVYYFIAIISCKINRFDKCLSWFLNG